MLAAALPLSMAVGCQFHSGEARHSDLPPYEGPPLTVEINLPKHEGTFVDIEITAPTGGYRVVEDMLGTTGNIARVYLTIEQPAHDEVVTMALVTHQHRAQFTRESFHGAKVYVNLTRRGEKPLAADYRLAAQTEAPGE